MQDKQGGKRRSLSNAPCLMCTAERVEDGDTTLPAADWSTEIGSTATVFCFRVGSFPPAKEAKYISGMCVYSI